MNAMDVFAYVLYGISGVAVLVTLIMLVRELTDSRPPLPETAWVEHEDNSAEKSRADLLEHLSRAREEVLIVCGSAGQSVYGEEVATAMRAAVERGVKIEVITGPHLDEGGGEGGHPLLKLAGDGVVDLYQLPEYSSSGHFRVTDGRYYTAEAGHGPDAPRTGRRIVFLRDDPEVARILQRRFKELKRRADRIGTARRVAA